MKEINRMPEVGDIYSWDFGGTNPEVVTVFEVKSKIVPAKDHADGSHSPARESIKIRITEGFVHQWLGWYPKSFELVTPI